MLTCSTVLDHTHHRDATITLDETARHRRRMMMTSDRMENGSTISFLLDLPSARLLRHGEGLQLSDGRVIEVRAKPEPLLEVTGRDSRHLLSLAWQIGNRHLACQILPDRLLIRRDPVIRDMLTGLGAQIIDVEAPFDPEGGAYDKAHGHSHSGDAHSHDHAQGHDHKHGHGSKQHKHEH